MALHPVNGLRRPFAQAVDAQIWLTRVRKRDEQQYTSCSWRRSHATNDDKCKSQQSHTNLEFNSSVVSMAHYMRYDKQGDSPAAWLLYL